ncbi:MULTISPECIES: threonine ammonia-lyase [Clostridium]|uniref:L-threonine dehydratase catabolic TdcB n=2 Tax=root TaxID=1 RepID=R9BSH9_9CLOT|nr:MULTISPECIES: threonine ammonia-lyase [Clostridium]EOR20023.1 threonine dehydratase [Clostridium sartagoforme AAU1]KLE16642.1 threonine dehydratase [Clostridium sp. C8]
MHFKKIEETREKIKDVINKTPILYSPTFSKLSNCSVYMKCENLQVTGAYKIRGALNKIRSLSDDEKSKGVVCSSAGNHAQGVAYAAELLGVKSTIVMPRTTPYLKIQSTKDFGGEVVLYGNCYDDAFLKAKSIEENNNSVFIHPFNDINVIYGQGTIALEILEEMQDVDVILCPIGGGGLISGISLAAKEINPKIKIIGVQAEGANAMEQSFKNGSLVSLNSVNTIADGIAVKCPGDLTYRIIQEYVDDIITVSDKEIAEAFLILCEKHKLLAEASGAASLAALRKLNMKDKKIVPIISGGNIDMITISSLINDGLVERGRLFCFSIELPDTPGQLLEISKILSELNANVVQLEHNQFKASNRLKNVLLEVTVETNGIEHINLIKESFTNMGFKINQMY